MGRDACVNPLKEMRERMNETPQQLAKRGGVTDVTVYNWESGRRKPMNHAVYAFERMYGIGKKEAVLLWYTVCSGEAPEGEAGAADGVTLARWTIEKLKSFAKLARMVGTHEPDVCVWMNGKRILPPKHLKRVARALGRSEADVAWASWCAYEWNEKRGEWK